MTKPTRDQVHKYIDDALRFLYRPEADLPEPGSLPWKKVVQQISGLAYLLVLCGYVPKLEDTLPPERLRAAAAVFFRNAQLDALDAAESN